MKVTINLMLVVTFIIIIFTISKKRRLSRWMIKKIKIVPVIDAKRLILHLKAEKIN